MSVVQACAQAGAVIDRARSLFVVVPEPSSAASDSAARLQAASESTARATDAPNVHGALMTAHHAMAARSSQRLARAAGADAELGTLVAAAAELTARGAAEIVSVAEEHEVTARTATTATTPTSQRAVLTALRSQLKRTAHVVDETRRSAEELTSDIRPLDDPTDGPIWWHPKSPSRTAIDGVHGTDTRSMPEVTGPGGPMPRGGGWGTIGPHWVEALPGSGVWIPSDQISGNLWMSNDPTALPPGYYEEIAPGIWWPTPPAVDPAMDLPSYRWTE